MGMRRFQKLWKGTLPLFLVFWAAMMAILAWLNLQIQGERISQQVASARQGVERSYEEIWAGEAEAVRKPVILISRLGAALWQYPASAVFRVYDSGGEELARSQLAKGVACPYGTGSYSWTILMDPVLTDGEQVELARRLREDRQQLALFYGTAGGLHEEYEGDERVGLYCEVTGVVDEDRQVVWPRKLSYVYEDRTVTLVDSSSDFFQDRELTTLRFDAVQLESALVGTKASPQALLDYYRQAEARLDEVMETGRFFSADGRLGLASGSRYEVAAMAGGEIYVAYAYDGSTVRTALLGLGPAAVLTLLAAVAMAAFTDRRQRQALQRERAFTRAAAHELKTPLAILRAHAESLREDIDPAKRAEYLDVVLSETDRMSALTAALLDLARLERGAALHREPVELSALVKGVFDRLALPVEQKRITMKLDLSPVWTQGDRARLESVAANLASNALRHCPPGGTITVKAGKEGRWAVLTVDNDGAPIPEADLAHIWEPFYRGDAGRSRATGGTGLGLAIVKAAAQADGGGCSALYRPGGVIFRVWLPCLQKGE